MNPQHLAVVLFAAAGAIVPGLDTATKLLSPVELRAVLSITALDSAFFAVFAAYRYLRLFHVAV